MYLVRSRSRSQLEHRKRLEFGAKRGIESLGDAGKMLGTQMSVTLGHSERAVAEHFLNILKVRTAHPHPRRGGMPQIVQVKILDPAVSADPQEADADVIRRELPAPEYRVGRLRSGLHRGAQDLVSHDVQPNRA